MTATYDYAVESLSMEPPKYGDISSIHDQTTRNVSNVSSSSPNTGHVNTSISPTAINGSTPNNSSKMCRLFLIIVATLIIGCAIGGGVGYLLARQTFPCGTSSEGARNSKDSGEDTGNMISTSPDQQCTCPTCAMVPTIATEPEWKLVFKAVAGIVTSSQSDPSGILRDPFLLWERDTSYNEDIPNAQQLNTDFKGHFKSAFVLGWERRKITEVKLALLDRNGYELINMVFDGENSNSLNWFSKSRLISSSWDDILSETQNYFSLQGHDGNRRIYVNKNHGGCNRDSGWMNAVTGHSLTCQWERRAGQNSPKPNFLYSLKKTFTLWENYQDVGVASILAIFVKTEDSGI